MKVSRAVELLGLHATAGSELHGLYCWIHEKHILGYVEVEIVEALSGLSDDSTIEELECALCCYYRESTEDMVDDCLENIEDSLKRGANDAPLKSNGDEETRMDRDTV